MSTARYLTPVERERLLAAFQNPRDLLLAQLGLNTGLRCSELIGLRWKQLIHRGQPAPAFDIQRRALKGGRSMKRRSVRSRRIPLNAAAAAAIREYAFAAFGSAEPPLESYVFASRKRYPGVISRKQAHRVIAEAAKRAGLEGTVAPHSLRRVFARSCYKASGHDILATQVLLGHANFTSSAAYLMRDTTELSYVYDHLNLSGRTEVPRPTMAVAIN